MFRFKYLITIIIMFFFFLAELPAGNIATYSINGRQVMAAKGDILVRFEENFSLKDIKLQKGIVGESSSVGRTGIKKLKVLQGLFEEVLEELASHPGVKRVQPNYIYRAGALPEDYDTLPDLNMAQWGLVNISAPSAWEYLTFSTNVIVAVLDTGIDGTHEKLSNSVLPGADKIDMPGDGWDDVHGHGTHVAGIIGAEEYNISGVRGPVGVSWNVQLMPVKVLNDNGQGKTASIIAGIEYAVDNGADIINMSLGIRPEIDGLEPEIDNYLKDKCNVAFSSGVFIVAASGNYEGAGWVAQPAVYDSVMAVGASGEDNRKAGFSQYGDELDLVAPGVNILSTLPDDNYGGESGTSMATPFVSGAAALLISYMRSQGEWPADRNDVTPEHLSRLKSLIVDNADDYSSFGTGAGILNVYRSLSDAAGFYGERREVIVYPNPFNPHREYASIRLPEGSGDSFKSLKIFSLDGRLVRKEEAVAGPVIKWNGTNEKDSTVAPGLYFFMAETEDGKRKRGKATVLMR